MVASAVVAAVALVACRGLIGYEDGLALEPGDGAPADGDTSDRGGPDAVDAETTDAPDAPGLLRVFVTSASIVATDVWDAGVLCSSEAQDAGLPGTRWVAWRSRAEPKANAIDLLPDGGTWYLTGGDKTLFIMKAEIANGNKMSPRYPLRLPGGGAPDGGHPIWTATGSYGQRADTMHCLNWSSSDAGDAMGSTTGSTGPQWTYSLDIPCSQSARVICFELP